MGNIRKTLPHAAKPFQWSKPPKRPTEIKTNYCLATWSGPRKGIPMDDSFLRKHIEHLNTIKHSLSQVTIGHPRYDSEDQQFTTYLRGLSSLDDGTPIVVHYAPNKAMSYGQWSRIFELYRKQFTHYIFIEDDYVPVKDEFDSTLVNMYEKKRKDDPLLGFLCGLVLGRGLTKKHPLHAAISNGISSSDVLQEIFKKFGTLVPYNAVYSAAQVKFSRFILETGFSLDDYLDQYRSVFYKSGKKIAEYLGEEESKDDLIMPIQCLKPETPWDIMVHTFDNKKWEYSSTLGY